MEEEDVSESEVAGELRAGHGADSPTLSRVRPRPANSAVKEGGQESE